MQPTDGNGAQRSTLTQTEKIRLTRQCYAALSPVHFINEESMMWRERARYHFLKAAFAIKHYSAMADALALWMQIPAERRSELAQIAQRDYQRDQEERYGPLNRVLATLPPERPHATGNVVSFDAARRRGHR